MAVIENALSTADQEELPGQVITSANKRPPTFINERDFSCLCFSKQLLYSKFFYMWRPVDESMT